VAVLGATATRSVETAAEATSTLPENPPVAVLGATATRSVETAAEATSPSTTSQTTVQTTGQTTVQTTTTAPAPAPATATDRIAQAKSLVLYDWQSLLPGWTIGFEGPNGAQRGGTYNETKTIKVFVSPNQPVELIAHTLAHELGHAVDITYMWHSPGDVDHQQFNEARGRAAHTRWVDPSAVGGASDFAAPVGDFAECFAWTVTNGAGGFYSRMGPPPDAATQAFIQQVSHRGTK